MSEISVPFSRVIIKLSLKLASSWLINNFSFKHNPTVLNHNTKLNRKTWSNKTRLNRLRIMSLSSTVTANHDPQPWVFSWALEIGYVLDLVTDLTARKAVIMTCLTLVFWGLSVRLFKFQGCAKPPKMIWHQMLLVCRISTLPGLKSLSYMQDTQKTRFRNSNLRNIKDKVLKTEIWFVSDKTFGFLFNVFLKAFSWFFSCHSYSQCQVAFTFLASLKV